MPHSIVTQHTAHVETFNSTKQCHTVLLHNTQHMLKHWIPQKMSHSSVTQHTAHVETLNSTKNATQ